MDKCCPIHSSDSHCIGDSQHPGRSCAPAACAESRFDYEGTGLCMFLHCQDDNEVDKESEDRDIKACL